MSMPHSHPYASLLQQVQKPSRYLGSELNSVHKDLEHVDVRMCLIFPDLYDLGLGNLGLHILYAILNKMPWCWTERSYAPAPDMDALLCEEQKPLFALESKDPLHVFDALGFTLQSELTYTNILNILKLSWIPLRAADRGEEHPLIFAGGPSVFNPEHITATQLPPSPASASHIGGSQCSSCILKSEGMLDRWFGSAFSHSAVIFFQSGCARDPPCVQTKYSAVSSAQSCSLANRAHILRAGFDAL